MTQETYKIYTDGGARNNPGPAGCGVVIKDAQGKTISQHKKFLGELTNNQAEYGGVIYAMEIAQEKSYKNLQFFLDSELLVGQLSQNYKVKNEGLAKLFVQVWNLIQSFDKVTFEHIPREKNKEADALVNQAIDEAVR